MNTIRAIKKWANQVWLAILDKPILYSEAKKGDGTSHNR